MAHQRFSHCVELVLEVVQHLLSIESEKSRRASLRAMALTSRAWCKPAIELLWKDIYGFEPILRCLPDDIWALDEDQYDRNGKLDWNTRVLGRRICEDDIARFTRVYGPHIKSLHIEEWPKDIVIEHLKTAKPDAMFPRLRCLDFSCTNAADARDYLRYLPYLTGKVLQELKFSYPGSATDDLTLITLSEAFAQITTDCPSLKQLSLGTDIDLARPPFRLSRLVREVVTKNWTSCLQELVVRNLAKSDLEYLSTLPNLHTLRLTDLQSLNCIYQYDPKFHSDVRPLLRPKDSAFPGLKHLRIDTTYPPEERSSNLMAVLQYLSPENATLTSLFLHSDPTCSFLDAWAGVVAMIATHCNKDSLTSLTFGDNIDGTVKFEYDVHPRDHLDLSPLFNFHNMTHFCHHVGDAKPLRGGDLKKLASAWVDLRELMLPRFEDPQADDDRMDCDDLAHLLRSLPQLSSLTVSVDLGELQDWLDRGQGSRDVIAHLQYIEFVNSEIYHLEAFLDFYTTLFNEPLPELGHTMGFDNLDMWIEAVALVRDIRSGGLDVDGALREAVWWHHVTCSDCEEWSEDGDDTSLDSSESGNEGREVGDEEHEASDAEEEVNVEA